MKRLEGKTAVITGGNSGIGLACACLFAREGAQVIITGRRKAILDHAIETIGHGAIAIEGDVACLEHHDNVAAQVKARFGGLDVYMANAGVITLQPSAQVSPDDYDAQFNINTRGVFFGVQSITPLLRDGASVILTSSLAATKVLQNHAVYAGSKAAIAAFARSWALELRARRIRVNVLSPGPVDTAIIGKLGISDEQRPDFLKMLGDMIPAGRLGEADELARAALYLASADSAFVNGIELLVDGGMSLT
ncbi:SDR family oxidoreductase [Pseudomonas sp. PDM04]|uniref:SDR family oxidoreductase n=1 Tax=Pseudomonas sp. PDM04 TaxID=2769296 RepID=UPI00177E599A|nr:SDR family oxidoreductase [Pseudomonas sp. PDM04]MBD9442857.1 SDR family oxidoreductase [Pseudomonas sp. PDM04]